MGKFMNGIYSTLCSFYVDFVYQKDKTGQNCYHET